MLDPSSVPLGPQGLHAHASEGLLRLVADAVPASIAYFEADTLRCRFANRRYAKIFGHTTDSILGCTADELTGNQAWSYALPHIQRCIDGERVKFVHRLDNPQGPPRMLEVHIIPHLDEGSYLGAFVMINDITHHWKAENSVRESEERMRKFCAATEEAIVFHCDGIITDGNEALERLTGHPIAQVCGSRIFDYVAPEYHSAAIEYAQSGLETPYEVAIIRKDGTHVATEVVGKTMPINGTEYRIVVLRDITLRKQAQESVAFMALHDTLTRLPNRRCLMEELDKTISRARWGHTRAALLFIDLDHFKTINDSLGHHAGDALLCEMADRLRTHTGSNDLVARLGGDEFVVVLPEIAHADEAAALADRLLVAMAQPHVLDGTPVALSPSIGISLYPEHGDDADVLLRNADTAMYRAKDNGRGNRQFYNPSMAVRAPRDLLQLEQALREAIATQNFVLHYQPQIRLSDGKVLGLEALIRWAHPTRGMVGPEEFIAFAEDRGLITAIGRWVLHSVCQQLRAWQDAGLALVPVAINLSALELRQRDVAAEIAAELQAVNLPPYLLEIEITESVVMQPSEKVQDTLAAIKAAGMRITIDDFGTGYSSLAYLKRYPIDKLKVDRSFLEGAPDHADDAAIVTAIVQMARSLHLQTVAEGVETTRQREWLNDLGCELAQGFGLCPPLAASDMQEWLSRHTP
jgi:diguanylate cyclase (GGDEF)-like protein/PAS domain S-box-containing protein